MNKILVEVSVGELLDKISILEIKQEKIKDAESLKFIKNEYNVLKAELDKNIKTDENLKNFFITSPNLVKYTLSGSNLEFFKSNRSIFPFVVEIISAVCFVMGKGLFEIVSFNDNIIIFSSLV